MKNNPVGMTIIVKTITRLTVGMVFLYGIYITLHGHLGPGGGFAGGVIVALSFIQILLAFGKEVALKKLTEKRIILLMSLGAIIFLVTAMLNFVRAHPEETFTLNAERFKIFGSAFMPLYDIAVCFMVAMGIFAIFLTLALFSPEGNKG